MNNKKRIITSALGLLLALSMILSGVACNQVPEESATEQKTEATETQTTANETTKTEETVAVTETETETAEKTTETEAVVTETETAETASETETEEVTTETETEAIPEVTMLPEQEVKVLSQNLLCDEHTISQRATAMTKSILAVMPDSFGVQECTKHWAKRLDIDLKAYDRVGVDCYGNDTGDFSTYIYYLKDKYKVIDSSTFWLSNTPDVPSQYNDNINVMNRTCTWAILENKETGFRYVHVNCHLDWGDAAANLVQIQMIQNLILRFEAMGYPVFATGDFNTKEETDSYKKMVSHDFIADTRYIAEKTTDVVSHYGNKGSVDFCFVTQNKMQVLEFDIIHNERDGVEVSDHNGVYAYAKVQSLPVQDHSNTAVAFPEDAKITTQKDSRDGSLMSVTFTQAKTLEGSVASSYNVVVLDENGNKFYSATVGAGQYRAVQTAEVTFTIAGGEPGHVYTVEITPVSIFGEKSEPISASMEWVADPNAPKPPAAPDIVNISVVDGKVFDSTENEFEIYTMGEAIVTENAMVFHKAGNIRTSSLAGLYGRMINGFTLEAVITTSSEHSRAHYSSNLHDGGFGLFSESGLLNFVVHNGKNYVHVTYAVQNNTKYHVVGVFNGKTVALYINGTQVNSVDFGGTMKIPTAVNAQYLCIGADANAAGTGETNSQCTVHKVAIYSEILTDNEIIALFMAN